MFWICLDDYRTGNGVMYGIHWLILGMNVFVGALREQAVSEITKFYVWNDGKKLFGQNW